MDKLNTRYWYANMQERRDEDYEEQVETLIRRVDVPMKAMLERVSLRSTILPTCRSEMLSGWIPM